ncbi:hypothetical protein [Psychroflexus aestuariivivens]|uniref:hypothetical protein n=1 Tax=Psychroflexus aestuariivivens TaxID=1795040 RepID=UPI000FDBEEB9|nr:hypothetical protein [Psychroflexus aestuariivivens]
MKAIIFTLLFFIGISSYAQDDSEKIEQLKIAYFTDELNLTSKEAKRFWPVYNKHDKLYNELKENKWKNVKSRLKDVKSLSDSEAEDLLEDYMAYKKQRVDYREEFIKELKTVISPKQIMMLKKAEYDFHKKLLKQYQSDKTSKN